MDSIPERSAVRGFAGSQDSGQFRAEGGEFGAEAGDFRFHAVAPVVRGGTGQWGWRDGNGAGCRGIDWAREGVSEGADAAAPAGRQDHGEGFGGVFREAEGGGFRGIGVRETVHAAGAGTQFTGSLDIAEEQFAEDCGHGRVETAMDFMEGVAVFGDAGSCELDHDSETAAAQSIGRGGDRVFVPCNDGVAVAALVAGGGERLEGEGIVFRGGQFLFEEAAEHAGLGRSEERGIRSIFHVFR